METCSHLTEIEAVTPSADGCEDWGWCYVDQLLLDATTWPLHGSSAHSV